MEGEYECREEKEENMWEQDGQDGDRQRESKERDILIEGAIMELVRSLTLGKFPGIHKDDLIKILSGGGEGA